jgi:hypothetical protein
MGGNPTTFDVATGAIRKAAGDVTSAVYDESAEALLQALELEAQTFKTAVLEPWPEPILKAIADVASANVERAGKILRDDGVATAFGIEAIANERWPLESDGAGTLLVAAVSSDLGAEGTRQIDGAVFTSLHRVAEAGRKALEILGAFPDDAPASPAVNDEPLQKLLAAGVSWQRSLRSTPSLSASGP